MRTAHLDAIEPVADHGLDVDAAWKPVRHHLGVEAFGMNAYVAERDGDVVIEEHDESDCDHQELYFVARGRAEFGVDGQTLDAPAGTFVFYDDPGETRRAVAREPGTAVIAVGAPKGAAFSPSEWETRRTSELAPGLTYCSAFPSPVPRAVSATARSSLAEWRPAATQA